MTVWCVIFFCWLSIVNGCEISGRTLQCSGLNLTEIPLPDVTLDSNVTNSQVRNFDLSFNMLQSRINFSNWSDSAMEVLDLSFNKLLMVDSDDFSSLKYLKELNLSNNMLISANFIWSQLPTIQVLNLANNIFIHGSLNIFSDLWNSSVTHLNLSATEMSHLPVDVFSEAANLESLDISGNQLHYIPNLPANLEYLDFSNNSIRNLGPDCFRDSTHLKTLILEYNMNLQDVMDTSFIYLLELRHLSFKGCSSLSNLPSRLFVVNMDLDYLSLAECNFRNISVSFKTEFLDIKKIDLENNPWHCSAHIKWFVQLHEQGIISDDIRCSTPENISLVEYLGPKVKHKVVRIVLTSICVIFFCILITAIAFSFNMEKKRRKTLNSYSPLESSSKPYRGSMIYVTTVV